MKLKQKLLVGLLAVGFASGAQADIATAASGDGSLYASVSNGATSSAVFDLGFVLSQFLPTVVSDAAGTTYTWNLDTSVTSNSAAGTVVDYGTVWDTFAATVTDWSTIVFDVSAGDSSGNSSGSDRYLTTSVDGVDMITSTNNLGLSSFGSQTDPYLTAANAVDTGAANGASFADGTGSTGSTVIYADGKGDSWASFGSWDTTQTVGTSVDFYYVNSTGSTLSAAGSAIAATDYAGTWLLDQNGVLTYSVPAVPEADTWAMFAAGLLAVGAIARRRMQA